MTKCVCENYYCLYKSILFAFGGLQPNSTFWTNPLEMKKWCRTDAKEQIKPQKICELENRLKIVINITGDYEYTSIKLYAKRITLLYKNDHYSFVKNPRINGVLGKTWTQDLTLVWFYERDDHILTYDGTELNEDYTLDKATFNNRSSRGDKRIYKKFDIRDMTKEMSEKLRILRDEEADDEVQDEAFEKCMVECYDEYMKNVNHLKEFDIDLSQHGYSIKDTAISIFAGFAKANEFFPFNEEETKWYMSCKCFGLMYAEPHEGHLFSLDINSYYPSIMRDKNFLIPMGNPEYKILEKIDDAVPFGIYRCVISDADCRLFITNNKNYYTSTDVRSALKRKYKVELIQDGHPNHLFYGSENRESGYCLFRGFVDKLYHLKKKNPLVKKLLNILWGTLCQKEKIYHNGFDFSSIEELVENQHLPELINDTFIETKPIYKLPYARVGIFLTALARNRLADVIADDVNDIKRIHTDGFYTTKIPEKVELSADIGKFKLECEGYMKVINMAKPTLKEQSCLR